MESCKTFKWNKKWFEPIKDIKINENRNFCLTLSIVKEKDKYGNVSKEPILSIKRWRRRRNKKTKDLFYRPSRGFNIRNKEQYQSIMHALNSHSRLVSWQSFDAQKIQEIEIDMQIK